MELRQFLQHQVHRVHLLQADHARSRKPGTSPFIQINDDDDDGMEISTFQADIIAKTPVKTKKMLMTNGERLEALMKDQDLRDKITVYLKANVLMWLFRDTMISSRC